MNLIILPNQLFPLKLIKEKITHIYLIEEPRYFTDFNFHKLKLMYHRASMKKYAADAKVPVTSRIPLPIDAPELTLTTSPLLLLSVPSPMMNKELSFPARL
jgi:hypothetical protein